MEVDLFVRAEYLAGWVEPQVVKEVKVEQNQEAQREEERTGWTNVDQQGAVMLCHIVWSHKLLFMFNSSKARNEWRNTQVYVVKIYSSSFDEVIYTTP